MTLDELAQAFAVRMQGEWLAGDVAALRKHAAQSGFLSDAALDTALAGARAWFNRDPAQLFVCRGGPCQQGMGVDPETFERSDLGELSVSFTECQGPCKQAPVVMLRVGARSTMFAQMHGSGDWDAILAYGRLAAVAGTLLVDRADAQLFSYDPVHHEANGAIRLQPLRFLIGRFTGAGHSVGQQDAYHKEVIGCWEAGGRFIGLRMAATYRLDDGRNDVHQALVLVGFDETDNSYAARAYTDGGITRDYRLTIEAGRVIFEDRVPEHARGAERARKILVPQAGGYDELLEVQAPGQPFQPFSLVKLRKP
jgi:hypothetical protein